MHKTISFVYPCVCRWVPRTIITAILRAAFLHHFNFRRVPAKFNPDSTLSNPIGQPYVTRRCFYSTAEVSLSIEAFLVVGFAARRAQRPSNARDERYKTEESSEK